MPIELVMCLMVITLCSTRFFLTVGRLLSTPTRNTLTLIGSDHTNFIRDLVPSGAFLATQPISFIEQKFCQKRNIYQRQRKRDADSHRRRWPLSRIEC